MIRSIAVAFTTAAATFTFGPVAIIAHLLRVPHGPDSIYDWCMRGWAGWMLAAAGARVEVHGAEHMPAGEGAVYIANHVSWFDIFALATVVPSYTFVAKMELRRIPIFGMAAEATGIVFIDRENRKTAFDAYQGAREVLVKGRNIVVCPEGTRGYSYALRPFKKGPFVLAISAQASVVPVFVYGAREVMPKGSYRIRSGTIHLHFTPAIETGGMTYDDRAALVAEVWHRLDDTFRSRYPMVAAAEPATGPEALT